MRQIHPSTPLKRLAIVGPIAALLVTGMAPAMAFAQDAKPAAKTETKTEIKAKEAAEGETKPQESAAEQKPAPDAKQAQAVQPEGETPPDYRDDRSTPQALITSYYNAINRKEYARAYSYYSEEGREPDFATYVKGYEHTANVKIALGSTEPDPGAGQIYWSLPLAIQSETDDGKSEVYTGCYTIRMINPSIQEAPPFRPMSIMTGSLTKSPLELDKSVPESCEAP